ncbi:MAG: hypothetical protein RLZZ480_265 [Candidatus Parcubacteria bacterium]|jgi:hypothetical protein
MSNDDKPRGPNFRWYEYVGLVLFCAALLNAGQCSRQERAEQVTIVEVPPE